MSRYPSIFGGDSQSLINPGIEPSNSSSFAAAYVHHKPTRSGNTPHTGLRNKPAPWSHSFPTATSFGQTGTLASVPPLHHNPRSRSIMQLPFQMHNGRRVTLNIMLPPGFPKERPVLSVGEPLVHPWIGFGGQLDFPSLRSWAPTSSLVKVVQDAYQGLGGRPQSPRAAPPAPATSTGAPPLPPPPPATSAAVCPDFASLLDNVPTEQLAQAAQDADAFEALYQQLIAQQPDEGTAMLQRGQAALVEQAQANLQKEAALNDVRNQLAVIRSADCEGSVAQFNARRERVQAMIAPVAPGVLIASLQAAAQETDAESEQVVRRFITGQLAVDDFVGQYGDLRTLFHKRDLTKQAAQTSMPKR